MQSTQPIACNHRLYALAVVAAVLFAGVAAAEEKTRTFVNPVYAGQDPYIMVGPDGAYYQAASIRDDRGIRVYRSESLTDRGIHRDVFSAPDEGPYRAQWWAPEIHYLDGSWYIYTCADDGDNAKHRVVVLKADSDDPLGSYSIAAELDTPAWAIDATIATFGNGRRYCIWSGWPVGTDPDSTQHLFISEMESPTKLIGDVVDLSTKMYPWETAGRPAGLNEGAQVLRRNGKTMIIYAASGSWTPDYCFGLMTLEGDDPLDASAWKKQDKPWFSRANEVYGPGHGCLVASPDGTEDWLAFHSSIDAKGSWNRCISLKKVTWNEAGMPEAGQPAAWGEPLSRPSGEAKLKQGVAVDDGFASPDAWEELHFFNGRTLRFRDGVCELRADADRRFGDKILLRGYTYDNFVLKTQIQIERGKGAAGVIFRVQNAGIGRNNFQGYVANITTSGDLVLARCDGNRITPLAKAPIDVAMGQWHDLSVAADGSELKVYITDMKNPKLTVVDKTFAAGKLGVRGDDVRVEFRQLSIEPITP
ncbi:family 43 glycosylhydrolase [Bremerella sp. P1]|uniref:family 43 glycosylhydrolase n=1 Tax=Bremerella sp. P1 TaxID=3026424 RepID=UPI00236789A4|nr:family 43 glycosylhydrolase [Bremerella sp. P1]WDI41379.1 family 43 glycosylhydrolase [Bremerella sp. P1]